MHNLKTNFDKILEITKLALADFILADQNLKHYPNKPKMTDLEIIALAITAESLGIDSENLLFSKLKTEFRVHFPRLPDRTNYNRRRRNLQDYIAAVSENIGKLLAPDEKQFIIDSIPIPICQNPRILRSRICRDDPSILPARAYHASHKSYYFGFKMQLMISQKGIPISIGITPANVADVHALDYLQTDILSGNELIADKGYLSQAYQTSLFDQNKIILVTPLRANMKRRITLWNHSYQYKRKRIETLFSQLCDQLSMKRNYAKTINGLFTRLCTKISSVAVLQYINFVKERPLNHIKHALAF